MKRVGQNYFEVKVERKSTGLMRFKQERGVGERRR